MKQLYQITILAICASLFISIGQNYSLWEEIRSTESFIEDQSLIVKKSNDQLAQKIKVLFKYAKNTDFQKIYKKKNWEYNRSHQEYTKSLNQLQPGYLKYEIEKAREKELEKFYLIPDLGFNSKQSFEAKKSFDDILHIGYSNGAAKHCKYELYINGKEENFKDNKYYKASKNAALKIELNKIFISPDGSNLDTIRAVKTITGV